MNTLEKFNGITQHVKNRTLFEDYLKNKPANFIKLQEIIIMPEQQPTNQLNIELSEQVAEGEYANLAIITHSHAEFVIDFVNVMPGTPKSKVKSRVIFTPQHAKRFMKALTENISRFESANGKIQDLEEVQLPLNFGGPTAQA